MTQASGPATSDEDFIDPHESIQPCARSSAWRFKACSLFCVSSLPLSPHICVGGQDSRLRGIGQQNSSFQLLQRPVSASPMHRCCILFLAIALFSLIRLVCASRGETLGAVRLGQCCLIADASARLFLALRSIGNLTI